MISTDQVQTLVSGGGNVVGSDGEKIGTIGQVYLDNQTQAPEWVTVSTGMFGTSESFVPLTDASVDGNDIRVPFDTSKVKDAPRVDTDGSLSEDQEAELYRYYGLDYSEAASDSGLPTGTVDREVAVDRSADLGTGQDTSGPNTDDAMTRSEEQLRVGTEKVQTGKARLVKWIETEQVDVPVTVSREKARLVTEPITDANRDAAVSGADLTEEEHEVTLTEERPVVAKETVPVERVRLETETVQDEVTVTEDVRKERIESDVPDDTRR